MRKAFLLPFILLTQLYLSAADPSAGVSKAEQAYRDATLAHDAAALNALLTDDFQFIVRAGRKIDKAGFLSGVKGGSYAEEGEHEGQTIHVYGDAALLTVLRHWTNSNTHAEFRLIVTRLFVKQGGRWILAAEQATDLPAK